MPILYEGVNAEHETVRNAVFLTFSHGRILTLSGPNALNLIQKSLSEWLLPYSG
jgi:aminomethyltransferase